MSDKIESNNPQLGQNILLKVPEIEPSTLGLTNQPTLQVSKNAKNVPSIDQKLNESSEESFPKYSNCVEKSEASFNCTISDEIHSSVPEFSNIVDSRSILRFSEHDSMIEDVILPASS